MLIDIFTDSCVGDSEVPLIADVLKERDYKSVNLSGISVILSFLEATIHSFHFKATKSLLREWRPSLSRLSIQ